MATNRTNLAARPTHPRTTRPPSDGGPTTKDADPNATAAGGSDEVTAKHPLGDQSGFGERNLPPWPLPDEGQLRLLREVQDQEQFAGNYEQMLRTVREHRLTVLRGMPGTGLSTTAVHLLDAVAEGSVARLDLTGGVESIRAKDLAKKHGYVIRLPLSGSGGALTGIALDALGELLADRECYCVLLDTVGHSERDDLDDYTFGYRPPDRRDLLRRHLTWWLRSTHSDGTAERLLHLPDSEQLWETLGSRPRLTHVVRLAGLLVRHGRGTLDLVDLHQEAARLVSAGVAEWFGFLRRQRPSDKNKADNAIGLAAFRIALAVLNGSPYHVRRPEPVRTPPGREPEGRRGRHRSADQGTGHPPARHRRLVTRLIDSGAIERW